MNATFKIAIVVFACSTGLGVNAADWIEKAFPVQQHDFGTVAVGSYTSFEFPIKNPFDSEMRIASVESSCGCTTPTIQSKRIEPNASTSLKATFNTTTYRGRRKATITVVIDQPVLREIRLQLDGFIRGDLVLHPGSIQFPNSMQGESREQRATLMYAGDAEWKVKSVRSNHHWLKPEFKETLRDNGMVNVEISVTLSGSAPLGYFQDQLIIETSDQDLPVLTMAAVGDVGGPITVSPGHLSLGAISENQTTKAKLVIVGRTPFKLTSVTASGWKVQCDLNESKKRTHLITIQMTPDSIDNLPRKGTIIVTAFTDKAVQATATFSSTVQP